MKEGRKERDKERREGGRKGGSLVLGGFEPFVNPLHESSDFYPQFIAV